MKMKILVSYSHPNSLSDPLPDLTTSLQDWWPSTGCILTLALNWPPLPPTHLYHEAVGFDFFFPNPPPLLTRTL